MNERIDLERLKKDILELGDLVTDPQIAESGDVSRR